MNVLMLHAAMVWYCQDSASRLSRGDKRLVLQAALVVFDLDVPGLYRVSLLSGVKLNVVLIGDEPRKSLLSGSNLKVVVVRCEPDVVSFHGLL